VNQPAKVNGTYAPVVADLIGSGRDTIIWYAPGAGSDHNWAWSRARARSTTEWVLPGFHYPLVGAFSSGGADGLLWYEPTHPTDAIWYR
jgi:hypothetical protein